MNKRDTDNFFNLGIEPNENEESKSIEKEMQLDDVVNDTHANTLKPEKNIPFMSKNFEKVKLSYTQEVSKVGVLGVAFKVLCKFILALLVITGILLISFGGFYLYKQQKSMKIELDSLQDRLIISNETLTESSENIVEKMTSVLSSLTASTYKLSNDMLVLKQELKKTEGAIKKKLTNSNINNRKIITTHQENLYLMNDNIEQQKKYLEELIKSISSNEISIELLYIEVGDFKKIKTSTTQKFNKLDEAITIVNLHRKNLTQDITNIQKEINRLKSSTFKLESTVSTLKRNNKQLQLNLNSETANP